MSETLFVSDIHLDVKRSAVVDLFNNLLYERAFNADALYILGDLFEYWIGDDAPYPEYVRTFDALKHVTRNNVPIYFIHGNRDFLISNKFADITGTTLLPEEYIADVYGTKILLMHGDTLCTDDISYQQFRKKTHNKFFQWIVLHLPITFRRSLANHLRETSAEAVAEKSSAIMDANQTAIEEVMQKNRVDTLIHGHTHRPAIHEFMINTTDHKRIVLGDWYTQGSILSITKDKTILESISV